MNVGVRGYKENVKLEADIKETILEAQYGIYTYELTVFVTACTRIMQVKS